MEPFWSQVFGTEFSTIFSDVQRAKLDVTSTLAVWDSEFFGRSRLVTNETSSRQDSSTVGKQCSRQSDAELLCVARASFDLDERRESFRVSAHVARCVKLAGRPDRRRW
jgi:hypothetical protein